MADWERRGAYQVKRLANELELKTPGVEIQLFRFDGGKSEHYHKKRVEFYYITKGNGKAFVDGKTIELSAGTELLVPANIRHSFENGSENLEGIMIKTNISPNDIFED
jgi:mannose-6-phosphate isomerase-like protein (cupin superfamily)